MKTFGIIASVAILAITCVAAISRSGDDSQDNSTNTKVSTNQKSKSKLVQIESPDNNISIFISVNSIKEETHGDAVFRSAAVIYHFKTPMKFRDDKGETKEIHYIYRTVGYHCESKAYVTIGSVLYGKDETEPLFNVPQGEVNKAVPGTPAFAEVEYVCKVDLTPQNEPKSFSVIKPPKSVDI
jgi:hypothetical protein